MLIMTACGKNDYGHHEKGVANPDTSQTDFDIMVGMSALRTSYDEKQVLNELQDETGINIDWNVMSESLAEQVNIRIAGGTFRMHLSVSDLITMIYHVMVTTVHL